eukprot:364263-Chlamydomonas_euryale.AAC.2
MSQNQSQAQQGGGDQAGTLLRWPDRWRSRLSAIATLFQGQSIDSTTRRHPMTSVSSNQLSSCHLENWSGACEAKHQRGTSA